MRTLTVFTPAFNRAHTITRTYNSLCQQTCMDFEWLVIDDGSTDDTRALIEKWQKEHLIDIRYVYQENQGMHGAHNTAYKNITTELNVCIDSDDWMPTDAVEKIVKYWREFGSDKLAGLVGLDKTESGRVIGERLPENVKKIKLLDYYNKFHGSGDKKLVYRTDVIKQYPEYPIFNGEKYVGLVYKYALIDKDYDLVPINEVLCIVDYQNDGSSRSMWKQYWNNPQGCSFMRKQEMQWNVPFIRKVMVNVHYVSHSIRSRNVKFLRESPMPVVTFCMIIPGIILFMVIFYKVRNDIKMK